MNIPMDIGFDFSSSKSNSNTLSNSKANKTTSSSSFDSLLSNVLDSNTKNVDKKIDKKDITFDSVNVTNNDTDELNNKDLIKEISSIIEKLISNKDENNTLDNKDKTFNEDISFLQSITPLLLIDYNNTANSKEYYSDNVAEFLSNLSNNLSTNELTNIKDIASDFIKTLDSDFLDKLRSTENIELKKELLLNKLNELTNSNKFEVLNNTHNTNALNIEINNQVFDNMDVNNNFNSVKQNSIDVNGFYNTFKAMNNKLIDDKENIDLNNMDTVDAINMLSTTTLQDSNKSENIAKFNMESNNFLLNEQSLPEDLYTTITTMKNYNLKQLKLKLTPKELGEMTIDISQTNNLSNITLTISNQDTLNIVKSNLKEILEHLKNNGLVSSESSITVTTDSSSKESFSNFNQSYSNKKGSRNRNIKPDGTNDVSNDLVDSNVTKTDSNSLSVLA